MSGYSEIIDPSGATLGISPPRSDPNGTRTGLIDSLGREIRLGDTVLDPHGFEGVVVFANGAYRYDVAGGHYLTYHSSLVFGDGEGSKRLTVIKPPRVAGGPLDPQETLQPDGSKFFKMDDCRETACYIIDPAGINDHARQCRFLRVSSFGLHCNRD